MSCADHIRPSNQPLLLFVCPQANGLTATATAAELAWGTPVGHLQPPFDVVLASDVLYLADALPLFVATLAQLCGPHTQASLGARAQRPVKWFKIHMRPAVHPIPAG